MEAIAYLLSITTAEVVNAILVQPLWGMIIHIGVGIVLIMVYDKLAFFGWRIEIV